MVCLGNICRSPMAEGLMKRKISEAKLDWIVEHIRLVLRGYFYSGKKTWSNFGANLLHPNCDLSNITGCPIRLWLFHAKLSYYLLQYLLKLDIYYSHFLF